MKILKVNESLFKYDNSYKRLVKDSLYSIIANEYNISEKNFKAYDYLIRICEKLINENLNLIKAFENENKRYDFCAETIYNNEKLVIKKEIKKCTIC